MTGSPSFVPSCLRVSDVLEQHFDTAFAAPDGIARLRELILTLAMQGKLVEQDATDLPASELLKAIEAEKQRLSTSSSPRRRGSSGVKSLDSRLRGNDGIKIKPDEVPYELPQGWEWVRLGDICSYIQRGKGPKYVDVSTHRVISQKCVRWYGLDLEPARYIDPASLAKYEPNRFLRVGDLLWNSTGTGTIGRACLVPQELEDTEIVADSHVTVVRPIEVSSVFFWRWIQSPTVQNEIEGSASGTTNQIELNTSTVINHLMPLPPLPEQHRIVARIDQLMTRCDKLERLRKQREEKRLTVHAAAIKQLLDVSSSPAQTLSSPPRRRGSSHSDALDSRLRGNDGDGGGKAWNFIHQHFGELYTVKETVAELRKAILQLAVMGRLVPQDPNDPPASELLKEIEAEKQRLVKAGKIKTPKPLPPIKPEEVPYQLPQGWEWVRLGDISLSSDSGWSPQCLSEQRSNGQWGVLKVSAVSWGRFNPDENKALPADKDPRPECEVKAGDFLLSRANTDELVARSVIVEETPEKLMMSDKIVRFMLSRRIDKHFINLVNGTAFSRNYYIANASGTSSSMKNVSRKVMEELPIALPPLPEQHRIVARIDQLMALCDTLNQQIGAVTHKQSELLNAVMAQV